MNDGIQLQLNPEECREQITQLRASRKAFEAEIQAMEEKIKNPRFLGLFSRYSEAHIELLREYVENLKALIQIVDDLIRLCEVRVRGFEDLLNKPGRR